MTVLYYAFENLKSDDFILKALQKFTGQKKEFKIYREKNKKPYVKVEKLYFSLSHTDGFTVCAVSDGEVGADTEKLRKFSKKEKIMRRFLNEKENEPSDRKFAEKWTVFESRVKYFGESIFSPEKALNVKTHTVTFEMDGFMVSVCTNDEIIGKEFLI